MIWRRGKKKSLADLKVLCHHDEKQKVQWEGKKMGAIKSLTTCRDRSDFMLEKFRVEKLYERELSSSIKLSVFSPSIKTCSKLNVNIL